MTQPSSHTGRPYCTTTINHRVRGVLRFYAWAVRTHWLSESPLADKAGDFGVARRHRSTRMRYAPDGARNLFVLRQHEPLPRPLVSEQARELLATLSPPYDLMARWQLCTGLRVSELLRLSVTDIGEQPPPAASHHTIEILRKGRKPGYVVAPASLVDETNGYRSGLRRAWLRRARRNGRTTDTSPLFINARGAPAGKNAYQRAVSSAGQACGFKATTHLLRATFACMLLARLEHLANEGANDQPAGRRQDPARPRARRDHGPVPARHRRRCLRAQATSWTRCCRGRRNHDLAAFDEVAVRRFTNSELAAAPAEVQRPVRHDAPRLIRKTVVDFSSLNLPEDARAAIAQAFWSPLSEPARAAASSHTGIRCWSSSGSPPSPAPSGRLRI
jgi:integrase